MLKFFYTIIPLVNPRLKTLTLFYSVLFYSILKPLLSKIKHAGCLFSLTLFIEGKM